MGAGAEEVEEIEEGQDAARGTKAHRNEGEGGGEAGGGGQARLVLAASSRRCAVVGEVPGIFRMEVGGRG